MEKQQDRISIGLGRKMSEGKGKFGSYDFHVSYSSDVNVGETPEQAINRVKKVVEIIITEQVRQAVKGNVTY